MSNKDNTFLEDVLDIPQDAEKAKPSSQEKPQVTSKPPVDEISRLTEEAQELSPPPIVEDTLSEQDKMLQVEEVDLSVSPAVDPIEIMQPEETPLALTPPTPEPSSQDTEQVKPSSQDTEQGKPSSQDVDKTKPPYREGVGKIIPEEVPLSPEEQAAKNDQEIFNLIDEDNTEGVSTDKRNEVVSKTHDLHKRLDALEKEMEVKLKGTKGELLTQEKNYFIYKRDKLWQEFDAIKYTSEVYTDEDRQTVNFEIGSLLTKFTEMDKKYQSERKVSTRMILAKTLFDFVTGIPTGATNSVYIAASGLADLVGEEDAAEILFNKRRDTDNPVVQAVEFVAPIVVSAWTGAAAIPLASARLALISERLLVAQKALKAGNMLAKTGSVALKAAHWTTKTGIPFVAGEVGASVAYSVLAEETDNVSNMLVKFGVDSELAKALANNPDDPRWLSVAKNIPNDVVAGSLGIGAFFGLKALTYDQAKKLFVGFAHKRAMNAADLAKEIPTAGTTPTTTPAAAATTPTPLENQLASNGLNNNYLDFLRSKKNAFGSDGKQTVRDLVGVLKITPTDIDKIDIPTLQKLYFAMEDSPEGLKNVIDYLKDPTKITIPSTAAIPESPAGTTTPVKESNKILPIHEQASVYGITEEELNVIVENMFSGNLEPVLKRVGSKMKAADIDSNTATKLFLDSENSKDGFTNLINYLKTGKNPNPSATDVIQEGMRRTLDEVAQSSPRYTPWKNQIPSSNMEIEDQTYIVIKEIKDLVKFHRTGEGSTKSMNEQARKLVEAMKQVVDPAERKLIEGNADNIKIQDLLYLLANMERHPNGVADIFNYLKNTKSVDMVSIKNQIGLAFKDETGITKAAKTGEEVAVKFSKDPMVNEAFLTIDLTPAQLEKYKAFKEELSKEGKKYTEIEMKRAYHHAIGSDNVSLSSDTGAETIGRLNLLMFTYADELTDVTGLSMSKREAADLVNRVIEAKSLEARKAVAKQVLREVNSRNQLNEKIYKYYIIGLLGEGVNRVMDAASVVYSSALRGTKLALGLDFRGAGRSFENMMSPIVGLSDAEIRAAAKRSYRTGVSGISGARGFADTPIQLKEEKNWWLKQSQLPVKFAYFADEINKQQIWWKSIGEIVDDFMKVNNIPASNREKILSYFGSKQYGVRYGSLSGAILPLDETAEEIARANYLNIRRGQTKSAVNRGTILIDDIGPSNMPTQRHVKIDIVGMDEKAYKVTMDSLYQGETKGMVGGVTNMVTGLLDNKPALKFLQPFVRTPANLLQETLSLSPDGAVMNAVGAIQAGLTKKGGKSENLLAWNEVAQSLKSTDPQVKAAAYGTLWLGAMVTAYNFQYYYYQYDYDNEYKQPEDFTDHLSSRFGTSAHTAQESMKHAVRWIKQNERDRKGKDGDGQDLLMDAFMLFVVHAKRHADELPLLGKAVRPIYQQDNKYNADNLVDSYLLEALKPLVGIPSQSLGGVVGAPSYGIKTAATVMTKTNQGEQVATKSPYGIPEESRGIKQTAIQATGYGKAHTAFLLSEDHANKKYLVTGEERLKAIPRDAQEKYLYNLAPVSDQYNLKDNTTINLRDIMYDDKITLYARLNYLIATGDPDNGILPLREAIEKTLANIFNEPSSRKEEIVQKLIDKHVKYAREKLFGDKGENWKNILLERKF